MASILALNISGKPILAFDRRVGAVLSGEDGANFGKAIELPGRAHRLPAFEGMFDSVFLKTDLAQWLKDEKTIAQAIPSPPRNCLTLSPTKTATDPNLFSTALGFRALNFQMRHG